MLVNDNGAWRGIDRDATTLLADEPFVDLSRWHQPESHGRWTVRDGGLVAEWVSDSPSLFLKRPIDGDFVWQIDATRLRPDEAFVERFQANKHAAGADPLHKYNFNFWLRADSPDEKGDFFAKYPRHLGTGWNGMGDDRWNSLFTTVVRNPKDNWVRLRKSPGYHKVVDVVDAVPFLPYDQRHRFTFVLQRSRVKMFFDDRLVYDYADETMPKSGYLGLCVWLCVMRFEAMKIWQL